MSLKTCCEKTLNIENLCGDKMKRKYYLRGIGIGIIFSAVIMSIAYNTSDIKNMTEEEIIERAMELGMIYEDEHSKLDDLLSTITPSPNPEGNETNDVQPTEEVKEETLPTGEPETELDDDSKNDTEKEPTTDPEKSSGDTETDSDTGSNENKDEINEETKQEKKISVEITNGMSSETVAKLLKSKGVIEDPAAFNQYLILNKYTKDIGIGTYELEPYSSYKTITDIIILGN